MINAENFKKYFGEKMSEFLTALHNDKITNIHKETNDDSIRDS